MSVVDLPERLYWTLYLGRYTRGQAHMPYRSQAELRSAQSGNLQRMVQHAYKTVPFYRARFQERQRSPRDIRDVEDLAQLPLIGKSDIQNDPEAFLSTSIKPDRRKELRTSGSTGTPTSIWYDHTSLMQNVVYGERERVVLTHFVNQEHGYRHASVLYPGAPARDMWAFYRQKTIVPERFRPRRFVLSTADPLEENLARLNDFKPHVLFAFGSYLERFLRHLAITKSHFHHPCVILYGAAHLSSTARNFAEEELGIPVVSLYNACEAMQLGFMCEIRQGFHTHMDLCPLRLVDEMGKDVATGKPGEVVISNLVNRGTVLLNYRLGDMAMLIDEPCPCGRSLPRIRLLAGRKEDVLRLADGQILDPREIWTVLRPYQEIFQYRILQESLLDIRVQLVAAHQGSHLRDSLHAELSDLLGRQTKIQIDFVESIPVSERGKYRIIQPLVEEKDE